MSTITARPITGPAAWHGSDLAQSTNRIPSTPPPRRGLGAPRWRVKARGLVWRDITRPTPLPGFGRLAAIA
jgi:hypothetical protein